MSTVEYRTCRDCGGLFLPLNRIGRPPVHCSDDCRRAAEREEYRKHAKPRPFAAALDLTNCDQALRDRFWSKVNRREPDECWPWIPSVGTGGYGIFTLRKNYFVTASRTAYTLGVGPLADGEVACHRCDNPPCCNPAHLFKGTQSDNNDDCIAKGRGNRARGEATGNARLTEHDVRVIRATPLKFGVTAQLARHYGVDHATIRNVLTGKQWGHVK